MKEIENFMKTVAEGLKSLALGIEGLAKKVDDLAKAPKKPKTAAKPKKAKTATAAKARKKSAAKKKVAKKKPKKAAAPSGEAAIDKVFNMIQRSKNGITTSQIKAKTGYNDKKIRNIIYKLKKRGVCCVFSSAHALYLGAI